MPDKRLYEFGPYRLLPHERLLLREGEPVPLAPKAFETLVALVRRAGRLADKDELLKEVWPDSFVEESNLAQNVFALRKALGRGEQGPHYIETVPKRGYRFLASVRVLEDEGDELFVGERVSAHSAAREVGPVGQDPPQAPPAGEGANAVESHTAVTRREVVARAEGNTAAPMLPAQRPAGGRFPAAARSTLVGSALLAALLGIGVLAYWSWRKTAAPQPFQTMKISRMTTTGKATNAVISPDGKFIAHVVSERGQQSLWLRQVHTPSNVEIVPPAPVNYLRILFSRDGDYLYYVAAENNRPATLYQMPALGGPARKLMTNIGAFMALSPDEARVAFIRRAPDEGKDVLVVSNVDGSDERRLIERRVPEGMLYNGGSSPTPAWSPDGKRIAFASYERGFVYANLVVVAVGGGREETLSAEKWYHVGQMTWLPDASGLLVLASDKPGGAPQIWHLSYPEGSARRITNDLNRYTTVSATADSGGIATVQTESLAYIWVVPEGDSGRARQITSGTGKIDISAVWTPDGKIVYDSRTGDTTTGDSSNIWIMDADGGNQRQLTFEGGIDPDVTSDGRYIVFRSNRSGTPHIYRMEVDGGNVKQLTDGSGEVVPHLTPDGKWVFFNSRSSGNIGVWRVSIDGGEARQIVDRPSYNAHISPDGKWIACTYWGGQEDAPRRVAVVPVEGGAPVKLFDFPANIIPDPTFEWSPDGSALVYVETRGGVSNLWSQPLDGGAPVQLTDFREERIAVFNWSRDGKHLAVSRGKVSSDVVLIKEFR